MFNFFSLEEPLLTFIHLVYNNSNFMSYILSA